MGRTRIADINAADISHLSKFRTKPMVVEPPRATSI
jgi:hypothetical protein